MIPHAFIEDLLARVDVVDVVESHVPLKRSGSNFSARCPFHNEKTPSFTVSQTKQFYHCFGCGAHGTAISFLMEYQGMGYVDAVKELAARVGMTVPESDRRQNKPAGAGEDLFGVVARAARFYKQSLKHSDRAIAYLKGRGLSGEIAARFGLGYAPDGWRALQTEFDDYATSKALVTAGLVVEGNEGRRYDRFRDRVLFPIHNQRGDIIGFGGRIIDRGEPKYLNSPETPLFEKGQELYGLGQARAGIRRTGTVLVVEGYMDVVALAQAGVDYAVATLGTSTTPSQVRKLLRQADCVVFCFDADAAGQRAAWRALEHSLGQLMDGRRIAFLFLPEGEDPDSFVRAQGKDAFEALLAKAQPLSEFMIHELAARVDMGSAEGRAKFLQDAKPLLVEIKAPMLSLVLRKRVAELGGVSQAELDARYGIKMRSGASAPQRQVAKKPSVLRHLAEMLLVLPELALLADIEQFRAFSSVAAPEFSQAEVDLVLALLEIGSDNPNVRAIGERFRGSPLESLVGSYQTAGVLAWKGRELDREALRADFLGAWRGIEQRLSKARIDALLQKSRTGSLTNEDKALYRQLMRGGGTVDQAPLT
ncbi:MAG: DNA primase [Betaproteobacteria bacterium]|jgi:DNA primase|nr:MAG: DNA primase [Betaproteobacteria bacterium]